LNHTLYGQLLDDFNKSSGGYLASLKRRVSRLPHRQVQISGPQNSTSRLHFVHLTRAASTKSRCHASKSCKRIAVLLVHGWPGSFLEFFGDGRHMLQSQGLKAAGPSSSTAAQADTALDIGGFTHVLLGSPLLQGVHVDIIVPSLPG
jgi:hypothetical protein